MCFSAGSFEAAPPRERVAPPPRAKEQPGPSSQPASAPIPLKPVSTQPAKNAVSESRAMPLAAATASSPGQAMSKEDKAVEMARRKEERKQRIAQLKEQKKAAQG